MSDVVAYSDRAELSFLGSVAASSGAVLDYFPVTEEHFFSFKHRTVFQAMAAIHGAGETVTLDRMQAKLGSTVEKIGGAFILWDYFEYPTAAQAAAWFEDLENFSMIRRAQDLGRWIGQNCETEDARQLCSDIQQRASLLESANESENELPLACALMEKRLAAIERGEQTIGIQTPLRAWNMAFGGLVEGCMYGLAGRPGMGKTAMMEEIAAFVAAHGSPTLIFERDMSPQMWAERVACRAAQIPYWRYLRGIISRKQVQEIRDAIPQLLSLPIYLLSPDAMTAERMCSITRRYARSKGVKVVFLDHVQALRVGRDLREGLTKASLSIRQNTTDTGIPHVCLLHLNREGATKGKSPERPTAENIKEFDQFYGDCDGLSILWTAEKREELKDGQKLPMKFYVAKNRNGAVAEADLLFDGELMRFGEPPPK